MEEYGAKLNSISIHVENFEYTGDAIRSLYESEGYPLPRTSAHSNDAGRGSFSASREPLSRSHKFKLGDTVVFQHPGLKRPSGVYEVVKILPTEKAEPAYRIKSTSERHERAVEEHEISMA
ncbi:hypothetical protein DYH55_08445 [Methylovirgula sp. 4M-Z18]|nr:hypothetical protein DYH55_08445 [Methylovirgula sp. 4M-Z18]